MPSALLTCLLAPLGLGDGPLWVFDKSLDGLILIASTVASWPGANIWVARPPLISFILVVLGGLWLSLWQDQWRLWGVMPILFGCIFVCLGEAPNLLIDGRGKIAALHDRGTLYVSSTRRGKFTAETWQNSLAATSLKSLECEGGVCKAEVSTKSIIISQTQVNQSCIAGAILIHLEPTTVLCPEAYMVLDWYDIWRGGSHAIWITPQGLLVERSRDIQGDRPWTAISIPRKDRPDYSSESLGGVHPKPLSSK